MFEEEIILKLLDDTVKTNINVDGSSQNILGHYIYEYEKKDFDEVVNMGKTYLTDTEIFKAYYNYDNDNLLKTITLERYSTSNKKHKKTMIFEVISLDKIEFIATKYEEKEEYKLPSCEFKKSNSFNNKENYNNFLSKFNKLNKD